jgi:Ser/Thr protein kinase RdoA (MazF antagonist)
MKLSIMRKIVDTVDDDRHSDIADQIASFWEPDAGSVKFFRASANFVFVFHKDKKKYFLRFAHTSERQKDRIRTELDYLRHLSNAGIMLAEPVPSRTGNLVESVSTVLGEFHAVVFEGLPGTQMEFDEIPPEYFNHWGRSLGKLHKASQGYPSAGRPGWKDHLDMVENILPESNTDALSVLEEIQNHLAALQQTRENFGMIHFDYELDNIVWDSEKAGAIDFDDCANYWFAADIAFALRDLFDDSSGNYDPKDESFLKFIEGYRLERDISQTELDVFPLFMNLHNLITYAKLVRTLDPVTAEIEPAWLITLREKLLRKMRSYEDGFSMLAYVNG